MKDEDSHNNGGECNALREEDELKRFQDIQRKLEEEKKLKRKREENEKMYNENFAIDERIVEKEIKIPK